jgi:hypothetical protein
MRYLFRTLIEGRDGKGNYSPEEKARQIERGRRLALKHQSWLFGRIGPIERSVHAALVGADVKGYLPTTRDLIHVVYLRHFSDEPQPPLKLWMYERVRRAAAIFADPVRRGSGYGPAGLRWRLRPGQYFCQIRRLKTERDAARRRQKQAG